MVGLVERGPDVAELLYREGRPGELEACIAEGLPFVRERGFWSHAYNLELHRCVLQLRRGDLDGALAGLRELVHGVEDPGMLFAYSVPWLGRALARRGDPAAGGMLAATWDGAQRQRLLLGVAYAGLASVEWAWLAGRAEIAERVAAALAPRLGHPGAAPFRAELARYHVRAGLPADPFDGCPETWAAGLRGDWQAAAAGWERAGDPYEQALELTGSGNAGAAAEGLRILDAMDAAGAAARVRAELRAAGLPAGRGPRATTRANPAGLTERQLDVLELLGEELTNAQIAERLVLSVRTSTTTSPPSSRSWACRRGTRRPAPRGGSACGRATSTPPAPPRRLDAEPDQAGAFGRGYRCGSRPKWRQTIRRGAPHGGSLR